jgi:ABC-type lipoprotein export system ATPase subunit
MKKLDQQKPIIIQATHSKVNAAYVNKIINLKDGWIE